ncbi:hypothetical protein [Nocardia sp. NBC_00416]|uniref:hypothetical protein n=1 Tax=Nocardia sp. NBC_00416 TaxID=2975991 RepID=UPI003FA5F301
MDDIAAVAAVALTEVGHLGKAYPLTGPEKLTRADLVRELAAALGREIGFVPSSREETIRGRPAMTFAQWARRYADEFFGAVPVDR